MEHFAAPSPLREVEEHFSQLVASVQDYALFLLDDQGRIRSWNAGAERFKGYTRRDLGAALLLLLPAGTGRQRLAGVRTAAGSQRSGRFEDEAWRLRKDGSRFWANVVITALYDENKNVRGFLKITRDLTERKAAEEAAAAERAAVPAAGRTREGLRDLHAGSGRARRQLERGARSVDQGLYRRRDHRAALLPLLLVGGPGPREAGVGELAEAIARGCVEDEGWRVRKDGSLFWANIVITAIYGRRRRWSASPR